MHRPEINWEKAKKTKEPGTIEQRIFSATQKLITLRRKLTTVADHSNITWLTPHNIHVAGYLRQFENKKLYCLFNYSNQEAFVTWYIFKEHGTAPTQLFDHWSEKTHYVQSDNEYLILPPYGFYILEVIN
jgi:amylosucrase